MSTFYPCSKCPPEVKVKSFKLIPSVEEISKELSIDCVLRLVVFILVTIYNEKEKSEQEKIQNVKFEEKGNTKKRNGAKSCCSRR